MCLSMQGDSYKHDVAGACVHKVVSQAAREETRRDDYALTGLKQYRAHVGVI